MMIPPEGKSGPESTDHEIDVVEGDDEPFDDVESVPGPLEAELGSTYDHDEAVVDVVTAQVEYAECLRYAVDQHHVVDSKALLERGRTRNRHHAQAARYAGTLRRIVRPRRFASYAENAPRPCVSPSHGS